MLNKIIFKWGCAILLMAQSNLSFAQVDVQKLTENARKTIIHMKVEFVSPENANNVCSNSNQGTGFIVSKDGHVLTANHLFKIPKGCESFTQHKVSGNIGGYGGQFPTPMRIAAKPNEFSDAVLLKLAHRSNDYPVAPVCRSSDLSAGEKLFAFGFPHDRGFAPLDARYSNPDGGDKDRWVVSSVFTHGVSGGPVYSTDGKVVAFVQGGLKNTPAVRFVVPLRQVRGEIEIGGELPSCSDNSQHALKTNKIEINGSIIPSLYVINKLVVNDTVGLDYKRSSCSNSTRKKDQHCIKPSAMITGWNPTIVFQRNGGIDSIRVPQHRPNCIDVEWHATSGGRTGVGECRYHGRLEYKIDIYGEENRKKLIDADIHRFSRKIDESTKVLYVRYDKQRSVDAQVENWTYSVEIIKNNNEIILTDEFPNLEGFESSIRTDGTLIIEMR